MHGGSGTVLGKLINRIKKKKALNNVDGTHGRGSSSLCQQCCGGPLVRGVPKSTSRMPRGRSTCFCKNKTAPGRYHHIRKRNNQIIQCNIIFWGMSSPPQAIAKQFLADSTVYGIRQTAPGTKSQAKLNDAHPVKQNSRYRYFPNPIQIYSLHCNFSC